MSRDDTFWNKLYALEKTNNFKDLISKIKEYKETYFLFNDIVEELEQYQQEIQDKWLDYNQKELQNNPKLAFTIEMKKILNKENLEHLNFEYLDKYHKELLVNLVVNVIENEGTSNVLKLLYYEDLVSDKIECNIQLKNKKINPIINGSFLESKQTLDLIDNINNKCSKYITIKNIAINLMFEQIVDLFPNVEQISNIDPNKIIEKARALLNTNPN